MAKQKVKTEETLFCQDCGAAIGSIIYEDGKVVRASVWSLDCHSRKYAKVKQKLEDKWTTPKQKEV